MRQRAQEKSVPTPHQNDNQADPKALKALARLLARQAARDLVSETVPGSSPERAANDKEHRHGGHDEQDR